MYHQRADKQDTACNQFHRCVLSPVKQRSKSLLSIRLKKYSKLLDGHRQTDIQNELISSNKKRLREMDQSFLMKDHYEILNDA